MDATTLPAAEVPPVATPLNKGIDERVAITSRIRNEATAERAFLAPVLLLNEDQAVAFVAPDADRIVGQAHAQIEARRAELEKAIKSGSNASMWVLLSSCLIIAGLWSAVDPLFLIAIGIASVVVLGFMGIIPLGLTEDMNRLSLPGKVAERQPYRFPGSLCHMIEKSGSGTMTAQHLLLGERGLAFRWYPNEAFYAPYSRVTSVSAERDQWFDGEKLNICLDFSDVAGKQLNLLLVVSYPLSDLAENAQDMAVRIAEMVVKAKKA